MSNIWSEKSYTNRPDIKANFHVSVSKLYDYLKIPEPQKLITREEIFDLIIGQLTKCLGEWTEKFDQTLIDKYLFIFGFIDYDEDGNKINKRHSGYVNLQYNIFKLPWKKQKPLEFIQQITDCVLENELILRTIQITHSMGLKYTPIKTNDYCKEITESIHYCYVLEVLTEAMADETKLTEPTFLIQYAFETLEHSLNTRYKKWTKYVNLFEKLKVMSIKSPFRSYVDTKMNPPSKDKWAKTLKDKCDKYGNWGMSINVFEAMCQDTVNGYIDNVWAGWYVMLDNGQTNQHFSYWKTDPKIVSPCRTGPVSTVSRSKTIDRKPSSRSLSKCENFDYHAGRVACFTPFPIQWSDIYYSWNACFVSGFFENTLNFFAKLALPQVSCYKNNSHIFIYKRVIALQLHIYFEQFTRVLRNEQSESRKELKIASNINWKSPEFTKIWGKINHYYAASYFKAFEKAERPFMSRTDLFLKSYDKGKYYLAWKFIASILKTQKKIVLSGRQLFALFKVFYYKITGKSKLKLDQIQEFVV
jgi:hypothetical protein